MQFFQPCRAFVPPSIDCRGDGQRAANDGTDAGQEARERLGPLFSVDDFHGGNILARREEEMLAFAGWRWVGVKLVGFEVGGRKEGGIRS